MSSQLLFAPSEQQRSGCHARRRRVRGDVLVDAWRDHFGIAQSHLYAIDLGQKEPSATSMFRIAMLDGKTIEWLLTGARAESDIAAPSKQHSIPMRGPPSRLHYNVVAFGKQRSHEKTRAENAQTQVQSWRFPQLPTRLSITRELSLLFLRRIWTRPIIPDGTVRNPGRLVGIAVSRATMSPFIMADSRSSRYQCL